MAKNVDELCYRSKGSARETRTQLIVGAQRAHLTEAERVPLDAKYEEIGKMLSGLIDHLEASDWRHRRPSPPHQRKRS